VVVAVLQLGSPAPREAVEFEAMWTSETRRAHLCRLMSSWLPASPPRVYTTAPATLLIWA
jgi:hypothetical protein